MRCFQYQGFHHAAAKCDNKVIIDGDHAGDENDLEEKIWALDDIQDIILKLYYFQVEHQGCSLDIPKWI